MSKPLGIGMSFDGATVSYRVNSIDRVTDQVWDAVEAAVCAHWTVEQFMAEIRQAWAHELTEHAKIADAAFQGKRF